MTGKATIKILLVPESENADTERLEKEITESLHCDWLAEVEKVTIKRA